MRGPSLIGTVISLLIFFYIIRFAFYLFPYLFIGYLIWYVYRKLVKPFFFKGQDDNTYGNNGQYRGNVEKEEDVVDPLSHQVKSVHDDQFFKQDHNVVDVDYEDEDEKE